MVALLSDNLMGIVNPYGEIYAGLTRISHIVHEGMTYILFVVYYLYLLTLFWIFYSIICILLILYLKISLDEYYH